ncbi:Uncharacterised protein [Zhongshania aliphaticivorans]|uniref:AsmA domain-containing protein n=1 Tax=Zhongshania aliphaticivorans TaxID=1470434 RepID=A0A5S9N569_9GAMM|nr:AsmA family protein [Zhongshania aliphaticivorans]CAA0082653.1 Uncharacterised protein [Zhongshania aliphaticivorans]CAA0084058.1 Uncharacterised protein [Zhongshania aliphaticivorans]
MGRALKYAIITIVSVVLVAVLAAASLAFWIDPNIFKDDIEALAAEQGLTLKLEGDLAWQVWPNIQIVINGASVAPKDDAEIMRFEQAQLSVALMPLLNKDIIVQGISLVGVKASLSVDENGKGNWTSIGKQDSNTPETPTPADTGSQPLQLAIAKLALSNSQIIYSNKQTGQHIELDGLSLSGSDIQLNSQAFPLELESDIRFTDSQQSVEASIHLNSLITVNSDFNDIVIDDSTLNLSLEQKNELATLSVNSELNVGAELKLGDTVVWRLPKLSLIDTDIRYAGSDGSDIEISALSLNGSVIPGGEVSTITLSTGIRYSATTQAPIDTQLKLNSGLRIDEDLNAVNVSDLKLTAQVGNETMTLNGGANATLSPLGYQTTLTLLPSNLKKVANTLGVELPAMAEPNALSKVGAEVTISGDDKRINVSKLRTTLDSSIISGNASVGLGDSQAIKLALNIDNINLDHYLPPVEESKQETTTKQAETPSPAGDTEVPIPRELLNSLDVDAKVQIGALTANQLPFTDLLLQLNTKNGVSSISPLSGSVYDSPFTLDAQLDSRPTEARMLMKGSSKQLPLGKVLKDAAAIEQLSGISDVSFNLNTSGNTVAGLKKQLNGNIELSAQELRLSNMNIEKAFCQLVAKFQQETFDATDWPMFSDLKDTTTKITIKDGVAKIETLSSGVTKLVLSGNGKINLNDDSFDVVISTRLAQADQNEMACKINNEKLLNRDIPIRCKAAFDSVGATSCLPDFRVIEDIAKEKAKEKINEKAKELIDKKMGGENGEAAKQLFNQFFNK